MGWKSTEEITREEAFRIIFENFSKLQSFSNSELEDFLEDVGFGDDYDKPYYGKKLRIND